MVRRTRPLRAVARSTSDERSCYAEAGSDVTNAGGAVLNEGTLCMWRCNVSANTAYVGAGIFTSGELRLYNSSVSDNVATADGLFTEKHTAVSAAGGICASGSRAQVYAEDSVIERNQAIWAAGILSIHPAQLTLIRSHVRRNLANDRAGGLFVSGRFVMKDGSIDANQALYAFAGGIEAAGSSVDVEFHHVKTGTLIRNNSASQFGGGVAIIVDGNASFIVEGVTVEGNRAARG